MKILADTSMPFASGAFSTLGETTLVDGRTLGADDLHGVDLLFVRSTTRVDDALLRHADRLQFVGSGVAGTDHVDVPLLAQRGIAFASAAGCNAESVAQYVTAALLHLARRYSFRLRGKTMGIVGAGNVGKRVVEQARGLGLEVLVCDPPRQRDPGDSEARGFLPFGEVLARADILTLHVPLNTNPADSDCTRHLLNAANLPRLKPGALLINAARGPVVDGAALLAHLYAFPRTLCALDTWANEPLCDAMLASRVHIATPHIAGHSVEGKVNGTRLVYEAACRYLNATPSFDFQLPSPPRAEIHADAACFADPEDLLHDLALAVCDLRADDAAFRVSMQSTNPGKAFDLLRQNYNSRREFSAYRPVLQNSTPALRETLRGLGFQVAQGVLP